MTGLITDPGFDINRTEEYKLSIQVSLDGFSFSVIHAEKKQLLALDVFPVELSSTKFLGRRLKEWVQKNDILRAKYSNISIIYNSESLTFVPSEIYETNQQETIGKLVFGNQNGTEFIDNPLEDASGNLIFPVSAKLVEELRQLFPDKKLLHPATLIDNEVNKLNDKKENTLALFFGRSNFTLLLYANSKLKAVNSYSYTNSGDIVYYTIAAVKKLKLVPDKTALFLAGEINIKGEIHDSLKKFFNRTIFFIPEVHYNSNIFKEPLHRFIVLF